VVRPDAFDPGIMREFATRVSERAGELTVKSVGRSVGINHGLFAFGSRFGVAVLHADDAFDKSGKDENESD
jgi:hypothetical protein